MPSPNSVKNSEVPIIVIVFVNQTNDGFSIIPSMFGEHEDEDGYRAPGKLNAKKTGERNTILTIVYFLNSQLFFPLSPFLEHKKVDVVKEPNFLFFSLTVFAILHNNIQCILDRLFAF